MIDRINKTFRLSSIELLFFFSIYTVAHGGILFLTDAVFWDDWTLWNTDSDTMLNAFVESGSFLNNTGYMHLVLLSLGLWSYKVLTFSLTFISGLLFNRILANTGFFNAGSRQLIVALFLISPLFIARVAIIDFPYVLCVFFFCWAWSIISTQRLLSLLLFFISFVTPSLLMFYALPFFNLYYLDNKTFKFDLKSYFYWGLRNISFLLLPFAWFYIKNEYFPPSGVYAGYNENFSLSYIPTIIGKQIYDAYHFLRNDIYLSSLVISAIIVFFLYLAFRKRIDTSNFVNKQHTWLVLLGLITLVLGMFPYWVVGKEPLFIDWKSRHQLLMPFGVSILLAGLLACIPGYFKRILLFLIITTFLSMNLRHYYSLYIDWKKQTEIISFLNSSDITRDAKVVLFNDMTNMALRRTVRFYEWSAMLKLAYGEETRFGVTKRRFHLLNEGRFDKYFRSHYSLAEYKRKQNWDKGDVVEVTINSAKNGSNFEINAFHYE